MPIILNALSDKILVELINSGKVGVIPTDTVYGLVCSASDKDAVTRLYNLKSRDSKPGTVIASSIEQLVELGIKKRYLTAVNQFWPNAVSIVIPCEPSLSFLSQNVSSLACRVVKMPIELIELLNKTGPLLTSSANLPGEKPASTIAEAQDYFGDSVDFYVDGDDLSGRLPSTLIRVVDDAVEVLRAGAVNIDEETGRII